MSAAGSSRPIARTSTTRVDPPCKSGGAAIRSAKWHGVEEDKWLSLPQMSLRSTVDIAVAADLQLSPQRDRVVVQLVAGCSRS